MAYYVGIDIAKTSLIDFADRIHQLPTNSQSKILSLIEMDMGDLNQSLTKSLLNTYHINSRQWNKAIPFPILLKNDRLHFDVASCQFAVHYMFQSRAKAKHFFIQINEQLANNGVVVSTTVDARVISNLILQEVTNSPNKSNANRSIQFFSDLSSDPSCAGVFLILIA